MLRWWARAAEGTSNPLLTFVSVSWLPAAGTVGTATALRAGMEVVEISL